MINCFALRVTIERREEKKRKKNKRLGPYLIYYIYYLDKLIFPTDSAMSFCAS